MPETNSIALPAARWLARWSWCGPAVVMLGLGLWRSTRPELWRDELASWGFASRSVPDLLAAARNTNAAQAPYYLLLHFWMDAFGSSALSMRALSVLAMAGAAAFVTLIARDLAGTRAGVASGLIFAVIPSISRYAQEVRFYAFTMLFAALATRLLISALERPSRGRRWAGYAAAMTATGCTDLVALALLAGHGAWVALRWREDRDRRPLRAFAASAVASMFACAPLILLGSRQSAGQLGWITPPGFGPARYIRYGEGLFFSVPVAIAVLGLAVLAWATGRRVVGYLTAATVCPLAVVWLVSFGKVSYFFPRYELFLLVTLAVLAGIAAARWDRVTAVAVIALVALLGVHDQAQIRQPNAHNRLSYPADRPTSLYEYAHVAWRMGPRVRPGDGIVYADRDTQWAEADLGTEYYLKYYLPRGVPEPRQLFVGETAAQAASLYWTPCDHPEQCLGTAPRVWVVGDWPQWNPLEYLLPDEAKVLGEHYSVAYRRRAGAMEFALLIRRGTGRS